MRALGKTLVAQVVTLEPANPLRPNLSPGTIVLSPATCKAVLYADVEAFEERELGIHEKMKGLHDAYDISAIIATVDTDAIRMPERQAHGRVPHAGDGRGDQGVDGEVAARSAQK